MLTEEAIRRIQETYGDVSEKACDGVDYLVMPNHMKLKKMEPPRIESLRINTLSGLINMWKCSPDMNNEKFFIHIMGHDFVTLIGAPDAVHRDREVIATAQAHYDMIRGDQMHLETFIVELMTRYKETPELIALLEFVGSMRSENVRDDDDDGVSQKVTVKVGVASLSEAVVPNPIRLRPWCTFPEIDQPERIHVFRVKQGSGGKPMCSLYVSSEQVWMVDTIMNIKAYLTEAGIPESNIIY